MDCEQITNKNSTVIYATDLVLHCPFCGSSFSYKNNDKALAQALKMFGDSVIGVVKCCGKEIFIQKIRLMDCWHIQNGRILEGRNVPET